MRVAARGRATGGPGLSRMILCWRGEVVHPRWRDSPACNRGVAPPRGRLRARWSRPAVHWGHEIYSVIADPPPRSPHVTACWRTPTAGKGGRVKPAAAPSCNPTPSTGIAPWFWHRYARSDAAQETRTPACCERGRCPRGTARVEQRRRCRPLHPPPPSYPPLLFPASSQSECAP